MEDRVRFLNPKEKVVRYHFLARSSLAEVERRGASLARYRAEVGGALLASLVRPDDPKLREVPIMARGKAAQHLGTEVQFGISAEFATPSARC
jgi:hypothetical protein